MKKSLLFAISAQAITLIVLLVLAFQFFHQVLALRQYTAKVEHTYLVINQIGKVKSIIKDAESSSRGYLLTGDTSFFKPLSKTARDILFIKDSLHRLLYDSPEQEKILKKIDRSIYEKMYLMLENTRVRNRISIDSLNQRLNKGKFIMDSIDIYLDMMGDAELKRLQERKQLKNKSESLLPRYSQTAFFFAVLLTLVFGIWIYIELKKRYRFQHLLQVKLTELRQNNEELEHIAFAASHDLQEPLRKIRIFSDRLLLKGKDRNGTEEYRMMERINVAATRLQNLIGDLVFFNNLVQNRFGFHMFHLEEILVKCIDEIKKDDSSIRVDWNKGEEFPEVYATEEQVEILFREIFINSIQFKSHAHQLRIVITTSKVHWSNIKGLPSEINDGNFCRISISDNGIGFDETFKSKMFKPFQRLHNLETGSNIRRKGMGLAFCKRVMLNVGGWIDAEGKVGQGATIHLYFPLT